MSFPMIDPPESLKAQSCSNCYFRRGIKCRYAIQAVSASNDAIFPTIDPFTWCGNWQSMPLETINLRTGNA
jgi:hypothetical protein